MKNQLVSRQHVVLAWALAVALAFGLCPTLAFAADEGTVNGGAESASDAPLAASDNVAWGSFGGDAAGVTTGELPLAQESAELSWEQDLLRTEGGFANVSNLLVVDGLVYVAESDSVWTEAGSTVTNAVLRAYDAQTGELKKTWDLPHAIDSACRMAYADGIIAIPVSGGGLLGVAADTLEPRWFVESGLADSAQSLNSVAACDGCFVHTSAELSADWTAAASTLVRVDAQTGDLRWRLNDDEDGSYWGGAAVVNGMVVVGLDNGALRVVDFATGEELSETVVAKDARVRSKIVPCGENEVVFSTTAGELVKASIAEDGAVAVVDSVPFAASSTCTPAVVDGVAVVGGSEADYTGVLAEVDLSAMTIVAKHAAAGDVKSAPVVAQGADGLWHAYFTCNTTPGALYGVRLGDGAPAAFTVFEPAAEDQNYCMASPAADGDGRLFYANDSGTLFALAHDVTCGFADVASTDWVVKEGMLERVVSQGLMQGYEGLFRPWDGITRGEVVTVLYRAAGEPEPGQAYPFSDVAEDAFYHDAVSWARAEGIVSGYGDTNLFGPNDPVTREQLAKMLAQYAANEGGAIISAADPAAFEGMGGSELASDWAREGLVWCCANGILSGDLTTDTPQLNPKSGANRAMMAKMIVKTLEVIG